MWWCGDEKKCFEGAAKLKLESGYECIYISPDLTKEQQTLDKKLRDKLKEIRILHKDAKISHNEIIKFDNGNRTVLYPLQNWLHDDKVVGVSVSSDVIEPTNGQKIVENIVTNEFEIEHKKESCNKGAYGNISKLGKRNKKIFNNKIRDDDKEINTKKDKSNLL